MFTTIAYQVTSLFFIIFVIGYFFQGKNFQIEKKNLHNKVIIIALVGCFILAMYYLQISSELLLWLIIIPLGVLYLDFISIFFFYYFIFLGMINFYHYSDFLFFYIVLIILSKLILTIAKKYHVEYQAVYLISLIALNIELFFNGYKPIDFLIYNLSGCITWLIVLFLTLHFHKNNKIYNEYKRNAYIDPETNTKNYYCLINNSLEWLKNKDSNIALVLINIDRLKDINNLYGNQYGNKIINLVIECITTNLKSYGEIYRLDGDTFCVISINEKLKVLQTIFEAVRLDIDGKNFIIDENNINVSVSIGGYYGKIESNNIDVYIEFAQESLLNSKYIGRNKVIFNKQFI